MRRVAILTGGGVTHVAGGIGQLMQYVIDTWRSDPQAPRPRVIDTRGPGGKLAGVASFVRAAWQLARLCLGGHVDVVHANMSTRGSAVRKSVLCLLARACGVPAIMHMHGADLHDFFDRLGPLPQAGLRHSLRGCAYVVALGEGWRGFLVERVGLDAARVVVVRNGVPDPGFGVPRALQAAPAAPPTIVFMGRLGERKGVPELLAALASEPLRVRPWRAVLAGDGEVARFRALADSLDLGGRLTFAGWLDRAAASAMLRQADMLLLPSHQEGMPMVVIEALAHGVPVVATPVGANPEFLHDGQTALLVPAGDPAALAGAIGRLLDDAALRRALAVNGRHLFEQALDIQVVADRLRNLYEQAITRRSP